MVTQEFKDAVERCNLLRTRIMMKDSLIVDPTFYQFNEMYRYAKLRIPDLCVLHDGMLLEEDPEKWNHDSMNLELVQLVTNFSEKRIAHLKKVIPKVMAAELRVNQSRDFPLHTIGAAKFPNCSNVSEAEVLRGKARQQLWDAGRSISNTIQAVKDRNVWRPSDVDALEKAAQQIVEAARLYKSTRSQ